MKWYAEIQHGSVALATYPYSETENPEEIDRCLGIVRKDLKLIQRGKQPETFGPNTMRHYGKMTKLFAADGKLSGNPTIVVDTPDEDDRTPIAIVSYTAPTVPLVITHSFGTAYGEVKSLSATGRPYFALYDESTGKRMKVFYDDELLDIVRACYRSYVRVTGDITFNENGTKREMFAHNIQVVERDKKVPFSSLFGILGGRK